MIQSWDDRPSENGAPSPWYTRLIVVGAIVFALWYFCPVVLIALVTLALGVAVFAAALACVAVACTSLGGLLLWIITGRGYPPTDED